MELAQVAAGLPVAASLALAGGIASFREGRRRATLNEAMHELRRPLQVLSLALPVDLPQAAPAESSLQLATVALERLDREINGAALESAMAEVAVGELVEAAARRWRNAAVSQGGFIQMRRNEREALVEGNRFDLAQALDNLLSNAIEHGGGRVEIGWRFEGDRVCVAVVDGGASRGVKTKVRPRRGGRSRRGHGLRVVRRIAGIHGGDFTLRRAQAGSEAILRLPLRRQGGEG
ncbi:MAG TPA: ATP-binding protein [Solirubrobacterales bacterium]|nr:ATP-binding protein [Solirubrobacterales bacterium]